MVRLSDMAILPRDDLVEDIYNRFLAKFATFWVSGSCKSDVAEMASYAILSHRWTPHELMMSDVKALSISDYRPSPEKAPAYAKIMAFFAKAQEYNCHYAWFDSGCIDQTSPPELQESIPAMFQWYQNATICIVRLAEAHLGSNIAQDEWFRRGWTLQELMSPRCIKFYDVHWQPITPDRYDIEREDDWSVKGIFAYPLAMGINQAKETKNPSHVTQQILEATGIDINSLSKFRPSPDRAPIAISWMARRQTTVSEDRAYCLLGFFPRVQLSLNFGEGYEKAFYRLQMHVLDECRHERNLLAWVGKPSSHHSMFASNPDDCRFFMGAIKPIPDDDGIEFKFDYTFERCYEPHTSIRIRLYALVGDSEASPLVSGHIEAIRSSVALAQPIAISVERLLVGLIGVHRTNENESPFNHSDWAWNAVGRPHDKLPEECYYAILLTGDLTTSRRYSRVHTARHIWLDTNWVEGVAHLPNDELDTTTAIPTLI